MPFATVYVGAVGVPGTSGLPGNVDWLTVIGFDVVAQSSKPCVDPMNRMPPLGGYDLKVRWDNQTQCMIPEGASFTEKFKVSKEGLQVALEGTFTAVRARIEACVDTSDEFKWVWLAPLPGAVMGGCLKGHVNSGRAVSAAR